MTQSGFAVLDLCAATAYRAFISAEGPGGDEEANLETFRSSELRSQLPDALQQWFRAVRQASEWDLLKDLRDKYTHRIVRRDATIELPTLRINVFGENKDESPKDPPAIRVGQLHLSNETLIDTSDVGPRVHAYVETQLVAFSAALGHAMDEGPS